MSMYCYQCTYHDPTTIYNWCKVPHAAECPHKNDIEAEYQSKRTKFRSIDKLQNDLTTYQNKLF